VFPPDASTPPHAILPLERIGAIVEILICSGFPTQLLLIAVLHGFGMPIEGPGGGMNPRFVFTVSLADAVLVLGLVFMFLRAHGERAREVLIGRVRVLREIVVGIAMIPLAFVVVVLILALVLTYVPELHNVLRNPLEDMLRTRGDAAIFAVVVMVSGGVREEVQRGFIIHRFGQYLGGGVFGVIVYSTLFGLGHFEQGYDAVLATGTLGMFWGFVYLRRGSIVAPLVSHAGFNLAQVVKHVALGWLR
jgi:membrane protease YdiL (CAAX protease family)